MMNQIKNRQNYRINLMDYNKLASIRQAIVALFLLQYPLMNATEILSNNSEALLRKKKNKKEKNQPRVIVVLTTKMRLLNIPFFTPVKLKNFIFQTSE